MILKKPYAFLIKHFRLINLLLKVLASFIMYKTYHIVKFFNEYIKNNYVGNFYEGFYQDYISFFLFVALFLTIFGIIVILMLFIYKKKPLKIYASSLIYYILLYVVFVFIKNTMISMETSVISVEYSRIIRDISILSLIPQLGIIISFLIRGLGFNISKFEFEKDLKDLEINNTDNEEVEITIKNDGTKIKRLIRRFFREFRYYIKENKFIVALIIVISIIIIGFIIYKNLPKNYNLTYNEGDNFNIGGVTYNLEDSILTNIDYGGNIIDKNYYYLVVKLKVENNSTNDYNFDYRIFKLENGDNNIYSSQELGMNFIDYVPNKRSNNIKNNSTENLALIYKLPINGLKSKYTLKIDNGYVNVKGESKSKYIYVNLNPERISEKTTVQLVNLDEYLNFSDSNLKNTTLKFTDLIKSKKYTYTYETCFNGKCYTYNDQVSIKINQNSSLLVLGYDYVLDNEAVFTKTSTSLSSLIDKFAKICYSNNSEMECKSVTNQTPDNLKNKIILEVSDEIASSNEIYISFIIRNKEYLVRIN